MKTILNLVSILVLLLFVSCSQKSDEIWLKIYTDEISLKFYDEQNEFPLWKDYKKKDEWYVIKLAEEDVKNGYVLSSNSMAFHPSILLRDYISEVRLPSSITEIGSNAFWMMTGLKSVNIPSNVREIGECAFESCASLKEIELPNSVVKVGRAAFRRCTSLSSVRIPSHIMDAKGVNQYTFEDSPHVKLYVNYDEEEEDSVYENSVDYSWIVGTWSCTTPYGTTTLKFEGDGSSGSCAELSYGSYNYGSYSVKDDVLRYKLYGESTTTIIEIHNGHRLYFGGGYYLHKNY